MNRSATVALLVFTAIVTTSGCSSHRTTSNTDSSPGPALATPTSAESEERRATSLSKRQVDQFLAPSCERIAKSIGGDNDGHREEQIRKTTQYFTPMFKPGQDGGLREVDRRACINIEGSCIVGEWLYNYAGPNKPRGERYDRSEVPFKFGKGSGQSQYNTTNALDPCRTLAADKRHYPSGTVVYIPSMKKKCPQTGKVVDGCFIVGDVGSAITGAGRFDIFTGECSSYSKRSNTCRDSLNREFVAPKDTIYYVIDRDNKFAKELRQEADSFIRSNWRSGANSGVSLAAPSSLETKVKASFGFYMAKNCNVTEAHPRWKGFPVQRCSYTVSDKDGTKKTATVHLLNPSATQAANWIRSACAKSGDKGSCHKKVISQIRNASGFQFPVSGVVYEDIIPRDGVFEAYCFRDGVTVLVDGFKHLETKPLSAEENETCISGKLRSALKFARIHSGTREEYVKSGGKLNVGDSSKNGRRLEWLDAVRAAYQEAWKTDSYSLLNAWVDQN